MKKIKLIIATMVFIILDASVTKNIQLFNAVPMLTYAFVICVALLEEDFMISVVLSGICGILQGSLIGNHFELTFIFYSFTAIILNYFKSRRITGVLRGVLFCASMTVILNLVNLVIDAEMINLHMMYNLIFAVIYNVIAVSAIYALTKRIIYSKNRQSRIINNI